MNKQAEQSTASLKAFAKNHPLKKEQERVKKMELALTWISTEIITKQMMKKLALEALKNG